MENNKVFSLILLLSLSTPIIAMERASRGLDLAADMLDAAIERGRSRSRSRNRNRNPSRSLSRVRDLIETEERVREEELDSCMNIVAIFVKIFAAITKTCTQHTE